MTKQPPYVSKLRLSRICRWLLALGVVKLCIFGALVAGYPLPELSWDLLPGTQQRETAETTGATPEPAAHALSAMDSLLAQAAKPAPEATASLAPLPAASREDPQGSAAARAAAALSIPAPEARSEVIGVADVPSLAAIPTPAHTPSAHENTEARSLAVSSSAAPVLHPLMTTAPVADTTAAQAPTEDKSWWSHIQQLKALPFPRMGLDQVAHAATLDTPPPPSLPTPAGADGRTSAFTPPAQIPSGVNADGSPIAPRPSTAQPRPAGTSGPQFDTPNQSSVPSLLTPNTNAPTPKTDAYVAPEDPNRKQQDLARREQEVLVLKQQMEQRLEELQAAERKVQGLLEEAKDVEAKKVSRLAAIYVNMKPKQAAKALESMDERTAVKILAGMSPKQSGEILTYADPGKTAKLTELISRMRTSQ